MNYASVYNVDDPSQCRYNVPGCTDGVTPALNFNPNATVNDGSCVYTAGCTDSTATNYIPSAGVDDGSCIPTVLGCTNPNALNYDSAATLHVQSLCTFQKLGCTDSDADNFNPNATTVCNAFRPATRYCPCKLFGCNVPTATNYNSKVSAGPLAGSFCPWGAGAPVVLFLSSLCRLLDTLTQAPSALHAHAGNGQ